MFLFSCVRKTSPVLREKVSKNLDFSSFLRQFSLAISTDTTFVKPQLFGHKKVADIGQAQEENIYLLYSKPIFEVPAQTKIIMTRFAIYMKLSIIHI